MAGAPLFFVSSGTCLHAGQPPVPVAGMVPEKAGPQAALVPAGVAAPASRQRVVGKSCQGSRRPRCPRPALFSWDVLLSPALAASRGHAKCCSRGKGRQHTACQSWVIPTPVQGAGGICTSSGPGTLGQAVLKQAPKLQVQKVPEPLLHLKPIPCCAEVCVLKAEAMLKCFAEKFGSVPLVLQHQQGLFKCPTKAACAG